MEKLPTVFEWIRDMNETEKRIAYEHVLELHRGVFTMGMSGGGILDGGRFRLRRLDLRGRGRKTKSRRVEW